MKLVTKVVQSVAVEPITEAQLIEAVKPLILAGLPEGVVITAMDFVSRQRPARVELNVQASFGGEEMEITSEVTEPVVEPQTEDDEAQAESDAIDDEIDAQLDADQIAELEAMDSPFEQDQAADNESVIDEIAEQAEAEEDFTASGLFDNPA